MTEALLLVAGVLVGLVLGVAGCHAAAQSACRAAERAGRAASKADEARKAVVRASKAQEAACGEARDGLYESYGRAVADLANTQAATAERLAKISEEALARVVAIAEGK